MGASDGGVVFMRAVNCEGETKDKTFIAKLLGEAINEVGPQNVVQVITDNTTVCSAVRSIIEDGFGDSDLMVDRGLLEPRVWWLREVDTTHFMQTAPWLGLIPGADGQILQAQEGADSPIVTLFKSATAATVSNPGLSTQTSFYTISKQAEAADLLCKANMNTGSVLEYALAFTSAALDKYCTKWSAAPKTGFIDITTSKDFYRIFSGLQIEYLEESVQVPPSNHEVLGDSVAWGGCTIIYLLGQQLHFELFDFSYQVLNIAEVEAVSITQTPKNSPSAQGWQALLEAMKKARRLNNHVFSMLKARCPLEDKQACAIKQSGAPLHRVKFENTVSAFETLPQKGS
ncbi:hypothetical protein RHMOL_Rhmol05G0226300 [Rhododendron molle]|uniref:Uncharacterized protein n=1 Tax=Rhododendron molle TaxID=49168 RepID=A0ACC0NUA5_RHOML|nr:hypothetical protein RHMOL_Rhmol05G0226300 [Rhododendron molle]